MTWISPPLHLPIGYGNLPLHRRRVHSTEHMAWDQPLSPHLSNGHYLVHLSSVRQEHSSFRLWPTIFRSWPQFSLTDTSVSPPASEVASILSFMEEKEKGGQHRAGDQAISYCLSLAPDQVQPCPPQANRVPSGLNAKPLYTAAVADSGVCASQ